LTINGKPLPKKRSCPDFLLMPMPRYAKHFQETNGERTYQLLNDDDRSAFIAGADNFPTGTLRYSTEGVVWRPRATIS
jgi:signal peptidase I